MGKTRKPSRRRATRRKWTRATVIVMGLLVTITLVLETSPPTPSPADDASSVTVPPVTAPR